MQDKIQEIMTLLDIAVAEAEDGQPTFGYRCQIESKLRELVREPLRDEQKEALIKEWSYSSESSGSDFVDGIIYAEGAHGITNTSN